MQIIENPNDEKIKLLFDTSTKLSNAKLLIIKHQIHIENFNDNFNKLCSLWDKYNSNIVLFHCYLNNTIVTGFQMIEYIDKILKEQIIYTGIISFCYALRNHIMHNDVLDCDFIVENKNVILNIKKIQDDQRRFKKGGKEEDGLQYINANIKAFGECEITYGGTLNGLYIHNIINDFRKEVNESYNKHLEPECTKLQVEINELTQQIIDLKKVLGIKNIEL